MKDKLGREIQQGDTLAYAEANHRYGFAKQRLAKVDAYHWYKKKEAIDAQRPLWQRVIGWNKTC